MSKIRINELARQLEIPSHAILEMLPDLGVTEKKTHSSSVDAPVAELIRKRLFGDDEHSGTSTTIVFPAEPEAPAKEEPSSVTRTVQAPAPVASAPPTVVEEPVVSAESSSSVAVEEQPRSKPAPIRPPLAAGGVTAP